MLVEFGEAARSMALRATHHGDEETAFGQGVKIIGDGGERRVRRGKELRLARVGNIEEDFVLPFQHAQQSAASNGLAVGGQADVMEFVAGRAGA